MPFDDIDLSAGLSSQPSSPSDDIDLAGGIVSKPKRATSYDSNLLNFAKEQGLRLVGDSATGRVPTGGHNKGSRHYLGQAIDVDHNGVDVAALSRAASAKGFKLRDERTRPRDQKVWGGAHLHLEVDDGLDLTSGLSGTTANAAEGRAKSTQSLNQNSGLTESPDSTSIPSARLVDGPRGQNPIVTPRPTGVTTNDISWHFGMTPEEFQGLNPVQQRSVIAKTKRAVAIDQQKKRAGDILQPSYEYINTMRKQLGLSPKSVMDQRGFPSMQEQPENNVDILPFLRRVAAVPSTVKAVPLEEGLEQLREEREFADLKRSAPEVPMALRVPAQEFHRLLAKTERAIAGLADYAEMLPHPGRSEPQRSLSDLITGEKPVPKNVTTEISKYLKRRAALHEDLGNYETEDIKASLPKTAVKAVADAGMDLAALLTVTRATGLPFPVVMAGEAALNNSDKDAVTIGKETAKAYALGRLYEYLPGKIAQKLKITGQVGTRTLGAGLFGGAGAAQTAYEGGDRRQILSQAIAQGALGTLGGPHGEKPLTPRELELQGRLEKEIQERRSFERDAFTDKLTELPNQRAWLDAESRINNDPNKTVLAIDLRNFKIQNDPRFGGEANGDRELQRVANTLHRVASEFGDTQPFRKGGDEFRVETTNDQADAVARRIKELNPDGELGGFQTGLSIGAGDTSAQAETAMKAHKATQGESMRPSDVQNEDLSQASRPVETIPEKTVPVEDVVQQVRESTDKLLDLGVINHEQAYEAIKKASSNGGARKASSPDEQTTSARKADLASDRSEFDLPEWEPAERRTWRTALDEAKSKGVNRDAITLSEKILANPRSLNDTETAGLVLKLAELKQEHKNALIDGDSQRIETIEKEFDTVTNALKLSGTEKGRALAAQKLTINQDYDLITLVQRARAKGITVDAKKRSEFKELSNKISDTEKQLEAATEQATTAKVQKKLDTVSRFKVRAEVRVKLDNDFAELKNQFAAEFKRIRSGNTQGSILGAVDPEGKLTSLIVKMAQNRAKAGINNVGELVDSIHVELSKYGISRREVSEAVSGYGKVKEADTSELATNLREMKRQLRLALSIEDAQAGKKPLKSGFKHDPDSVEVKRLRGELQDALKKSGLDDATETKGIRLQERIDDLTQQLADVEALQRRARGEREPKAPIDPKNQPLKDKVDDLTRQLNEAVKQERENWPYQGPQDHLPAAKKRLQARIEKLEAELKDAQGILNRALGVKKPVNEPLLDREGETLLGRANRLRIEIERLVSEKRKSMPMQLRPRLSDAKKLPMEGPRKSDVNSKGAPLKQGPRLSDARKLKMEGPRLSEAPKQGPPDWLPAAKKRIQKRIDELERRIAEKDYSKTAKKDQIITPETLKLQTRLEDLKAQYETELHNAQLTKADKFKQYAFDLATVPKSIMSSADLSAPFRQGLFHTVTHPIISAKAFGTSLTAITNLGHARLKAAIEAHPDFAKAQKAGVEFTGLDKPNMREDHYISNLTKNLPVVKHSERAFTGFLDTQRLQVFSKLSEGVSDPKALQAIARMINIASGRADIRPGGAIAKNLYTANLALYSPRLVTSRIQLLNRMLNPVEIAKLPAEARGRLIRDNVKFLGVVATTFALASAAGLKVSKDPDDPDFLKIRSGNTRYDVLGGLVQPLRATIRIMKAINSFAHGDKKKAKSDSKTAGEVAGRFVRSKLSPEASFIVDWFNESDYLGRPFTMRKGVTDRLQPLVVKDMINAMREEGLMGAAKTTPAFFGLGVETYQRKKYRK